MGELWGMRLRYLARVWANYKLVLHIFQSKKSRLVGKRNILSLFHYSFIISVPFFWDFIPSQIISTFICWSSKIRASYGVLLMTITLHRKSNHTFIQACILLVSFEFRTNNESKKLIMTKHHSNDKR